MSEVKDVKYSGYVLSLLLAILPCFSLLGCSAAPSENTVKEVILNYFDARHYRVIAIDIGEIKTMPMGEKQYMGSPGYDVDVRSITLEVNKITEAEGSRSDDRIPQITFNNATVRIRQGTTPDKDWTIVNITGMAVP